MAIACPSLQELPPPPQGRRGWPWTEAGAPAPPRLPDGRPWPVISVVTPSYNPGPFLEEALRSVLLQGYPALEFIVMDGGSNDGSLEIFERYRPWLAHFSSGPDRGQSHAINKGLARARGELVFWFNADDLCLPGSFITAARALVTHPSSGLVVGGGIFIDAQGRELSREPARFDSWHDYMFRRCMIRQWCTFFRRQVLEEVGGVDENLQYSMDRDLLIRVTRHHWPLLVEQYFTAYRAHGGAKTRRDDTFIPRVVESDRSALAQLAGTPWRDQFRRWRAFNWLGFSQKESLSPGQRLRCIYQAVRLSPRVLVTPDFKQALGALWRRRTAA